MNEKENQKQQKLRPLLLLLLLLPLLSLFVTLFHNKVVMNRSFCVSFFAPFMANMI